MHVCLFLCALFVSLSIIFCIPDDGLCFFLSRLVQYIVYVCNVHNLKSYRSDCLWRGGKCENYPFIFYELAIFETLPCDLLAFLFIYLSAGSSYECYKWVSKTHHLACVQQKITTNGVQSAYIYKFRFFFPFVKTKHNIFWVCVKCVCLREPKNNENDNKRNCEVNETEKVI